MPMIIGEIRRYLRDNNTLRVSRSIRDLAYKALSAKEALSRKMGSEPSLAQITAALNESGIDATESDVSSALEAIVEPMSLFDPVYSDGGSDNLCVMDSIQDNSSSDDAWLDDIALREALKQLSERERNIINLRFFRGRTQMEIAEEIGISQAQVSRLEKGAIDKMRCNMQ